jgi:hypothetical protein
VRSAVAVLLNDKYLSQDLPAAFVAGYCNTVARHRVPHAIQLLNCTSLCQWCFTNINIYKVGWLRVKAITVRLAAPLD